MNHSRRWSIDSARRDATLSALQALRAAGQFTRLEVAHWLPDSPAPAPDAEAGWTLVLEVSDDGVLESECVVPDGAEVAGERGLGEQVDGELVHDDLVAVEHVVVLLDLERERVIAGDERLDGEFHGGFGVAAHGEQLLLQFVELFFQLGLHE